MLRPIQRVNVNLTAAMLDELDKPPSIST